MADFELVMRRLVPDAEHFSAPAFARRLEKFDGRAIFFVGLTLPPGYFGARIVVSEETENSEGLIYPAAEYVFFSDRLLPAHREHVKIHELAHIALGHPTLVLSATDLDDLAASPPTLSKFSDLCCRAADPRHFSTLGLARDQEAERLARLIYQRIFLTKQRQGLARHSSQQDLELGLQRLGID